MSDWIEWKGGNCPVNRGTWVDVKFSDGSTATRKAEALTWPHFASRLAVANIVAYRIAEGWKSWGGGENPAGAAKVIATLRCGVETEDFASNLQWGHDGSVGDIVSYRLSPLDQAGLGDSQETLTFGSLAKTTNTVTLAPAGIPTDSQQRKDMPIVRGCLDYFPDALLAVAELSGIANEKHNPGQPLHWSKSKSADHADCCVRHLMERGKWDTTMQKPVRHSTSAAWRALANLQTEIELEREAAQKEAA